ncbi:colicin immunity protein Cui [Escherichia coli]
MSSLCLFYIAPFTLLFLTMTYAILLMPLLVIKYFKGRQ